MQDFGVYGPGCGRLGFGVCGSGFGVWGSGFKGYGLGSGVWGSGSGSGRFRSGVCGVWNREARIDRVDLQKKGLMYRGRGPTRWSMAHTSKVNLHRIIDFMA